MTNCRSCGAKLEPELAWCPQCLTPVAGPGTPPPGTDSPSSRAPDPGAYSRPPTSIFRSGPNSFGIAGKLGFTAVAVAIGYGLYLGAVRVVDFYGYSGLALVWLFVGVYAALAILVLWGIWRPAPVEPSHRIYPMNPPQERERDDGSEGGSADPGSTPTASPGS